ncbi:MAG: Trk system potassium transporter TrkA [Bacteroidales bacterium]|nr:Trk system potassium transporter TrkA [Bacteroidales bacterium]
MKIIIAGACQVGTHLAKMLSSTGNNEITLIDSVQERLTAAAENADIVTICGDSSSIKILQDAAVDQADLFVAVNPSSNQNQNLVSALLAKKLGSKKVVARVSNEEYLSYDNRILFTDMGIDLLFYPERIAATEIVELLKNASASESLDFARGRLQLSVLKLEEDSPVLDEKLIDFSREIADKYNISFRIVAVSRLGETIIPGPDFKFKERDMLYIISLRESLSPLLKVLGRQETVARRVMILGGSNIGCMVATQLVDNTEEVKIIDNNRKTCLKMTEELDSHIKVVCGDARDTDLLIEEGIRGYDVVIAVTDSAETNILSCVAAKRLGVPKTIAGVENIEYLRLAEEMGIDTTINRKLIAAAKIFRLTLSDKVKFIKYMNGTNAEVLEYIVEENSAIVGKSLKDISFPSGALIGGVIRGTDAFIAVGSSVLKAYDRVIVFSVPGSVAAVDKLFK